MADITSMFRLPPPESRFTLKDVIAIISILAAFAATWYTLKGEVQILRERVATLQGQVEAVASQARSDHEAIVKWSTKAEGLVESSSGEHAEFRRHMSDTAAHRRPQ